MPDLVQLGLLGLFTASFLAGSVLPFPSEGVLAALVGGSSSVSVLVGVATLGNVLGAITLYAMGRGFGRWLTRDPARVERARVRIERWGAWSLLLAWVPIIGDAFVLGAGVVRIRFWLFLVLVTAGKGGRYLLVAYTTELATSG